MARSSGRLDVKQVLLQAVAGLDQSKLSPSARALLPALLSPLPRRRGREDVSFAIDRTKQDLRDLEELLSSLQGYVKEAPVALAPGSDTTGWWQARRRQMEAAADDDRPDEALIQWVDAFTEALAAGATATCADIVEFGGQRSPQLAHAMAVILSTGSAGDASLAALDLLLSESDAPLTTSAAVRLRVLQCRELLAAGDLESAARAGDAAIDVARQEGAATTESLAAAAHLLHLEPEATQASPLMALALAARAEVHLMCADRDPGQADQAQRLITAALRIVPTPPDVHVIAGLVAEADRAWPLAEDHYAEALKAGADGLPSPMRRPAPARLKIAQARRCRDSDYELAVELYRLALAERVDADGEELVAGLHVELARLLERTDSRQAAESYADAAGSYTTAGLYARAAEYYGKASGLEPENPRYWWCRAESLRMQAVRAVGIVDRQLLDKAQTCLTQGLSLGDPGESYPWVLVTQALIEAPLKGHRLDQLVLLERSLLLGEDYDGGYFFLIDQLRERGYPLEAYEAARQRHDRTPWDSQAVVQLAQQSIDLKRYDEAAKAVESQLWLEPDNASLRYLKALILLRQDRAGEAGGALTDAPNTPPIRLMRAYAKAVAEDYETAQREFLRLYTSLRGGEDVMFQAWAAFQTGSPDRLAEAIHAYGARTSADLASTVELRDMGQLLLARGDSESGDLEEGERMLAEGVARANVLDELVQLETVELHLLRHRVRGQSHEQRVTAYLDSLTDQIKARWHEVRQRRIDPDSTAGRLAQARTALAQRKPREALETYHALLAATDVPAAEVLLGANRAADALLADGDSVVAKPGPHDVKARLHQAEAIWNQADIVSELLPRLALQLDARRLLAQCADGRWDDGRWHNGSAELAELLDDEDGMSILSETTSVFGSRPSMLWGIHAALTAIGADDSVPDATRRQLTAVAESVPFSSAYRLRREELSVRTAAPLVALEILLGADQHDLAESDELNQAIPDLRERLAREMGVRIQGIRVTRSEDVRSDRVDIRLFAEDIGRIERVPDSESRVSTVMSVLESAVRERLYRLIGPDDISLWLEEWAPGTAERRELPSYNSQQRLGLARLLRMLLREGVAISDRDTLVQVFRDHASDPPLILLSAARRRLGVDLATFGPHSRQCRLPKQLEDKILAGLADSGNRWEVDRDDLNAIVQELRANIAAAAGERVAVVVHDARIRPFVWRLLAAERQPVLVLAGEELA